MSNPILNITLPTGFATADAPAIQAQIQEMLNAAADKSATAAHAAGNEVNADGIEVASSTVRPSLDSFLVGKHVIKKEAYYTHHITNIRPTDIEQFITDTPRGITVDLPGEAALHTNRFTKASLLACEYLVLVVNGRGTLMISTESANT